MTPEVAAELLARLGAGSQSHEVLPGGERRSDFALQLNVALGLCPGGPQLTLRVNYVRDEGSRPALIRAMLLDAAHWHRARTPAGYLTALIRMATYEHTDPLRCMACGGVGVEWAAGEQVLCKKCTGSGRMRPDEEAYAEAFGVGVQDWCETHAPRYRRLVATIEEWDAQGLVMICRQFRDAA